MSETFSKNRIIKNSATLYVRMMFTMVLNLLTTRFVLAALGVEDMGVYGVVGSIVSMFTVFVSGLLSAAQRFITYELGKPNGDVSKVFNTSVNLILLLSLGLLVVMEIGGWLMVEFGLNIPEERVTAAHWVLQFSILTCILNLNTTVYNALLIAHERMTAWAVISIIQVVFNCSAAYSLACFAESKRLVWYAAFALMVKVLVQILYMGYCKHQFSESRYQRHIDKPLVREMAKFAGASTFSGVLQMVIAQGLVLIVNWTYGVAVNAVYNIGMQVENAVLSFGLNVQKSVSPQITKTYAAGEYDRHCKLVYTGSKLGIYMTMLIFIPFCLRSHYILELWLGIVPNYTSAFTVGFVFQSLLYAGFEPFRTAVLATGRVGRFFIYSELVHLLVLPLAYSIGRIYDNPTAMVVAIVFMEFVYCGAMVWFGTRVSKIRVRPMLAKVVIPVAAVLMVSFAINYILSQFIPQGIGGLVTVILVSFVITAMIVLSIGLTSSERAMVMNIAKTCTNKIRKR